MSEQATTASPGKQQKPGAEFGRHYFRHDCGVPYERNDHWLEFFGKIADGIVRDLRPASVLDAGCAMGFLVEALRERGVDARGIDVSEYAISQVHESIREHCEVRSLTDPITRRYDLIVCIEVLEHIPAADADAAVGSLCAASDRLLVSTTPDDFAEPTHCNVRPPEAWSAAIAREGLVREVDRDFSYITPWAALYTRKDEPLEETVRRYDRSWARQRHEVGQLRESLLATQRQLAELEEDGQPPQLEDELKRREEEVLRLRDLLIGKDAELGAAKGHLAELEDHRMRIAGAKQRIASQVPGLNRLRNVVLRLRRSA
ncbi:MAG: methyltransferase domain-containing protein [Solirubrobacterales bacterium]